MIIINILSALLTPIIAIVTTIILIQQYRLEKKSMRFQLFEHRHQIYNVVMKFISEVVSNGVVENINLSDFMRGTRDCNIFFDKEISDYIDVIYKKAIELKRCNQMINSRKLDGKNHSKECDNDYELMTWFSEQFVETKKIFDKYLNFRK